MKTIKQIKRSIVSRWYFAKILIMYTSIYYKTRHYGGEEEGGWFYTNYMLEDSIFTPFGFGMYKAEKKLIDEFGQRSHEVINEQRKGMFEDQTTHHYE